MDREKMVKDAQSGDSEAFIALIRECEGMLYRTAKGLGLQDEDCADLLQDTVLTAFEKLSTVKEPAYFQTWIYRILLNKCYRFMKRNRRYAFADEALIAAIPSHDESALEFEEALKGLDRRQRVVLTLRYVNGMTTREISECLGESEGTVKSRISRARTKLKQDYYGEGVHVQ